MRNVVLFNVFFRFLCVCVTEVPSAILLTWCAQLSVKINQQHRSKDCCDYFGNREKHEHFTSDFKLFFHSFGEKNNKGWKKKILILRETNAHDKSNACGSFETNY